MKTEKPQPLSKLLSDFTYRNGYDISNVFDDFLRYIIWAHTMPEYGKPIKDWKYKPEESKEFFAMYQALILELQGRLKHEEWCDIFGEIYEALIAGKSRRSNTGQFFTPPSICNLMAEISNPSDEKITGKTVSDPTCGSGRNLLAFHVKHLGNYMVGEDLDRTCVMMTVCNFLLHGVTGEVIWHNSLFPDNTFYGAWRVNENLNNPFMPYSGVPHVRPITQEETLTGHHNAARLKLMADKERIKERLKTNISRLSSELRDVMRGNLPKEEKRERARFITTKIKKH